MINYYQLLDLDPDAADPDRDKATIRAQIDKMRGEWSSGTATDPRQATVNRARLDSDLIPDLEGGPGRAPRPEVWRQHRQLERERLKQETDRTEKRLGEFAALLGKRDGCTDDDVKEVVKQMKNEFPLKLIEKVLGGACDRNRVREWLKRRGVSFTAAAPASAGAKIDPLDPAKAGPIFAELDFLVGQGVLPTADLYALLAVESGEPVGSSDSATELKKMADKFELKLRAETDTINTSKLNLFGQCRDVLGDEANKPRYDITLAMRVLKPFDAKLRVAAGKDKLILPELQDEVIKQAAGKGVSAALARQYLAEFAASAGFTLVKVLGRDDLPRCGYCHTPAATSKDKTCPGCGRDLYVTCPNPKCGKTVPTSQRFCQCKYALGDAPLYTARLKEAEKILATGDTEHARELVTSVLEGWPGYPKAIEIVKQIETGAAALAKLEKDIAALLTNLKGHTARERLNEPGAARLPNRADLLNRAERLLSDAATDVAEGRRLQAVGRADDAIDRYEHALRACADHPEARTAMASCPPTAPAKLDVTVAGATANLRWAGSSARGTLRYHVVRKSWSAPRTPDDGTVVDTVTGTTLTDPELPVGEAVYYAVYTRRGDANSNTAAVGPPAFRVADVTALRAVGRDGCVELKWKAPAKAEAVEVWRQSGRAPARRGDGEQVQVVGSEGAVDLGLTNGRVYGYRVVAVFRGPDGVPQYAETAETTAVPVALPPQVEDLVPSRVGESEVEARWTPPKGAVTVAVFVSKTKPTRGPGTVLAAADLNTLGRRLDAVADGHARGKTDPAPVLHLIPVSIAGSTAVVGQPARLSAVPDVENLQVRYANGRLACRWDWPAGVNTVVVAWRTDSTPTGPTDRNATRQQCPRFQYDQSGGFAFEAPDTEHLHLVVYSAAPSDDGTQYAPGGPGARREVPLRTCTRVRYTVRERRVFGLFGSGEYVLTVSTPDDTTLPELLLVARMNEVPLDRDDGDVVHRIPTGTRCGPSNPYTTRFPANRLPRKPRFKLFTADPDDGDWLDLNPTT